MMIYVRALIFVIVYTCFWSWINGRCTVGLLMSLGGGYWFDSVPKRFVILFIGVAIGLRGNKEHSFPGECRKIKVCKIE
jgi:hypothetical protein